MSTTPNTPGEYDPTPVDRLLARVRYHMDLFVVVVGGALALLAIWAFDVQMTRFRWIMVLGTIISLPYGIGFGSWLAKWLFESQPIFVVELQAEDTTTGALHQFPPAEFTEWTVTDGDLDQWAPGLYCARKIDYDEQQLHGTWRGTLTDRELLTSLAAIQKCRGMLERDARRGFAMTEYMDLIIPRAVKSTVRAVREWQRTHQLPDEGEALDAALREVLSDFDLDSVLDDRETLADVAEDFDLSADELEEFARQGSSNTEAPQQPTTDSNTSQHHD